jgi:hypothetical protein
VLGIRIKTMGKLVTIEREGLDPHHCYGMVIARSPKLLLFHQEINFQFDGYMVIRVRDITRCESSDSNDYTERLMRRERLWESVPRWIRSLPESGWPELIGAMVGKVVILEDESENEEFWIGPILEARARYARLHWFDSLGRFRDVERVPYRRITSMKFGDRYSTIHAKYLSFEDQGSDLSGSLESSSNGQNEI